MRSFIFCQFGKSQFFVSSGSCFLVFYQGSFGSFCEFVWQEFFLHKIRVASRALSLEAIFPETQFCGIVLVCGFCFICFAISRGREPEL